MHSIRDAKSIEIRKLADSIWLETDIIYRVSGLPFLNLTFICLQFLLLQQVRVVYPQEQVGNQQWKRVSPSTLISSSILPQNLQDI